MTKIKTAQAWGHRSSPSALLHHAGRESAMFNVPYVIVRGLTEAEVHEAAALLAKSREVEGMEPEDIDKKYGLTGSCIGCRRVTWLCRRDRKCGKYNRKPKAGYIARPTGYAKPGSIGERGEVEK